MTPLALFTAALVLAASVVLGTIAHELTHALALRAAGVPNRIDWRPDRDDTASGLPAVGRWASVRIRTVPAGTPAWRLRAAAIAPLALSVPVGLVVLSQPFGSASLALQAATIGWLGCALPSPRDWSMFWHAESAMDSALAD